MSNIRWLYLPFFSALSLIALPGCYLRQAYYVSPFNGNTGDYHTQPMVRDSARSADIATGNTRDSCRPFPPPSRRPCIWGCNTG